MPRGVYPRKTYTEIFWGYVPSVRDGCWVWEGTIDASGYGKFGKPCVYAHRFSYELAYGSVPDGAEIDHLCRNRACVNPQHLEAVPHIINARRGLAGINTRSKTHCPQGHPYDVANTYRTPDGRRECRICRQRGQLKAAIKAYSTRKPRYPDRPREIGSIYRKRLPPTSIVQAKKT